MDLNKCVLIGHITMAGPKISWNDKGVATCTFWLRVDEPGKDGAVYSSYLPVELTGKYAGDAAEQLNAGDDVLIDGKLKYKSTGTRDGKKTGTIVVSTWFVTKAPAPTAPQDAPAPGQSHTQGDAWGAGPAPAATKKGKPRYPKWRPTAESPN